MLGGIGTTETVNTRDGRVVAVRRGEILLMTFFRPEAGVDGQVTFTGGYPFADDSTVSLVIGDDEFELFTEGEWAWPASTSDDGKIIAAMKRGVDAVLTAVSSRGDHHEGHFFAAGVHRCFGRSRTAVQLGRMFAFGIGAQILYRYAFNSGKTAQ